MTTPPYLLFACLLVHAARQSKAKQGKAMQRNANTVTLYMYFTNHPPLG